MATERQAKSFQSAWFPLKTCSVLLLNKESFLSYKDITSSSPDLWTGSLECPPLQRTHVRAGSATTLSTSRRKAAGMGAGEILVTAFKRAFQTNKPAPI
ncbi:TPA: hypothetical protein RFU88_003912 [Klebsiella aerogenes]|nr:hypothetical protein [Klebsiella aerogenes]